MGSLLGPFLVGMGSFWRSGGSKFRRGTQFRAPVLGLGPFFGVNKHESVDTRRTKGLCLSSSNLGFQNQLRKFRSVLERF